MEHQPAFTNYETGRDVSGSKVPAGSGPSKDGGLDPGDLGVSWNGGTQEWMVYKGRSYLEMDDLGVPLFQETSNYVFAACEDFCPAVRFFVVLRAAMLHRS